MDKNAIKKYAIWARQELIEKVSQKALQYGIEEDKELKSNIDSVNGILLTDVEKKQRQVLIEKVNDEGYSQVIEEVAYTWFNRFVAIRFMEVNGYLPSHVRVFSDENGVFKPQILAEAIHLDFKGVEKEKIIQLKEESNDDELFRYLLIAQCNDLNDILPYMFQKISDYTELLLPDYLIREGSVIEKLVNDIEEDDWEDQVQIIGWLYQYYNTEPKAKVFGKPKGEKISKNEIPAATQLFTPDWIVRYMVENSLGRLWLAGHPGHELKAQWKYYVDTAEQEQDVNLKIEVLNEKYSQINPEDIMILDPCQGSGHILAYVFDVLVQIYESYGYSARDAAASIVKHNIWGLDIDERAAQLAYFSIMMKARQYDRRFFARGIQPHLYVVLESNNLDQECVKYFIDGRKELEKSLRTLINELEDAKEYGSILNVTEVDFDLLYERFEEIRNETISTLYGYQALETLLPFVEVAHTMAQKYHVVITNPPYMPVSSGDAKLYKYVNKHYKEAKTDMFAVFIRKCNAYLKRNGLQAMITQQSWMFLSSYEELRNSLHSMSIVNMAHLGARAFEEIAGEVVQTTAFVLTDVISSDYKGVYERLVDGQSQEEKERLFLTSDCHYVAKQRDFDIIPGCPIAYWMTNSVLDVYKKGVALGEIAAPRKGNSTSNNNLFLRLWHEVDINKMNLHSTEIDIEDSKIRRWYPYNKGGGYRKWYGFNEYLIDWYDDAAAIRAIKTAVIANYQYFMKPGLTWSTVSTNNFSIRWFDEGYIFDNGGCCIFELGDKREYLAGLLNSSVFKYIFGQLNPTLNFQSGEVAKFPVILESSEKINSLVRECVAISKQEYDSYESSWGFLTHPLVCLDVPENTEQRLLIDCYSKWEKLSNDRFSKLKANEEELNEMFIEIYGLRDELSKDVPDKEITLRKANLQNDIRSLISYAVGCMFGRYSLDVPGIAYAGGAWNGGKYSTFLPDLDNIIPICDDEYFDDDIVGRFIRFIEVVYGKDTLEENLQFIADILGGNEGAREVIRNYFINDFYSDHLKIYQKRPIYWLFDSGKKNGFKCLIYMHRYQPDTIARIRTDYVHEQQARYRTAIEETANRIENASGSDKVKLTRKLITLKAQNDEIHVYEEKIHHLADQMISIDLDDGVKKNYEIFKDVLAKIK